MNLMMFSKTGLVLILSTVTVILSACSGTVQKKQASIWDQRRNVNYVSAPVASDYKQQLAAIEKDTVDVEQGYQVETAQSDTLGTAEVESDSDSVEKVILSMPATHYTVQLLATVDIERVNKFIEESQVSVRYVVPTERDGIIWYVLLLDVYPGYSVAKASMEDVSASLTTQPWVRTIGSVQKLIQ